MSVVKIDKIDFSNISVADPIKQDGLYLSKVQHHNKDLVIQTPKSVIASIDGEDTIEITIDSDFKSFLDKYDNFVINLTHEHSNKWFSKELSKSQVSQIYKKPHNDVDGVNTVSFKIDENVLVYSRDKQMNLSDLEPGMEVIILVHASYIVFYKTNCIPYFNALHIKLKEKKIECEFREVEEEQQKIPIKINTEQFEFN